MIELKRLKLINWHNFENVTFDCARLTYMIGVNAVGKTTILDAIRYCLTTNRNFNALGNKKSGRTLQGSVHAKQRGENAYRRPGRTVAYIGAEFWDTVKRTNFVIAVRVESEGPMQELHPGDQTWYISEDGITLEKLPFLDPHTGAPSAKEDFKPAVGRLSYTRSPSEARDRICRALGIGRASSPLGKSFPFVFSLKMYQKKPLQAVVFACRGRKLSPGNFTFPHQSCFRGLWRRFARTFLTCAAFSAIVSSVVLSILSQ